MTKVSDYSDGNDINSDPGNDIKSHQTDDKHDEIENPPINNASPMASGTDFRGLMTKLTRKYSTQDDAEVHQDETTSTQLKNLQKKYDRCLQDRNEVELKANGYKKLYDASNTEIIQHKKTIVELKQIIERLNGTISELNKTIEELKTELENQKQSAEEKIKSLQKLADSDNYSDSEKEEKKSQKSTSKEEKNIPLSHNKSMPDFHSSHHESTTKRFPPSPLNIEQLDQEYAREHLLPFHDPSRDIKKKTIHLTYFTNSETIQIPSPEEMEVFRAQQNSLKSQIEELYTKASEDKKKYEDSQILINDKDKTIKQQQNTIQTLEKSLAEQRNSFNERLLNYKNEATRYIESMMIEKKDIDNNDVHSNNGVISDNKDEIQAISTRLVELERKNTKLQEELSYSQESFKMMQRQNRDLQLKCDLLTNQKLAIEERNLQPDRRDSLEQYATRIKQRYTDLKRKYENLQAEYDELKNKKANRFDPFMMTNVIDKAIERNRLAHQADSGFGNEKKLMSKVKTTEIAADNLRARNEELQQLLNKSNNTIDRLNQLLTRKETQLAAFHEQIADLKQQIVILNSGK